MLEKIGLPAKPSLRGNTWVVDASHCQGCSSQFTFINRKHHCRRCGGIFCNTCTQQRMVLRGQGDAPVRICEPCKTLEEAARFEMRYGHRNRAGRGSSKSSSKYEDDILNQILGNDGKNSSSAQKSNPNMVSSIQRPSSSASNSSANEVSILDGGGEIHKKPAVLDPNHAQNEIGSISPEELRQQALQEKKSYKILKGEGKREEALKAFKRGKELERQADALETSIKKIRRKASMAEMQNKDGPKESGRRSTLPSQVSKENHDLIAELKELGWTDTDPYDEDKKPASLSIEGELSSLLGEVSQRTNKDAGSSGIDKAQVVAHKRKALALKREGNLAEAKEELKKAKILEKQLEEQELLGAAEDSDDELSAIIRSMDDDKEDQLLVGNEQGHDFDLDHLMGSVDDLAEDRNLEVTDEDLMDPEIAAAMQSLGWADESDDQQKNAALSVKGNDNHIIGFVDPSDTHATSNSSMRTSRKSKGELQRELLGLKRKALALRREGKTDEAEEVLKSAKVLETQMAEIEVSSQKEIQVERNEGKDDNIELGDKNNELVGNKLKASKENRDYSIQVTKPSIAFASSNTSSMTSKSKGEIQRELLGLKRKALALRREGKTDEVEEALRSAKELETQMAELDAPEKEFQAESNRSKSDVITLLKSEVEEGDAEDVTEKDMHDPALISILKNLGWNDEELEPVTGQQGKEDMAGHPQNLGSKVTVAIGDKEESIIAAEKLQTYKTDSTQRVPSQSNQNSPRQEILAHKRKAVALKREGKLSEAREELRQAKLLEKSLESHIPANESSTDTVSSSVSTAPVQQKEPGASNSSAKPLSGRDRFKLQQESLSHKRQALKLRREGRMEEAEAEFELAKNLEMQLEEVAPQDSSKSSAGMAGSVGDAVVEDFLDPQLLSALKAIGIENTTTASKSPEKPGSAKISPSKGENVIQERIQLEEQIKAERVKALNLKRSGKQAEALDALRQAKLYEKKLNSLASN